MGCTVEQGSGAGKPEREASISDEEWLRFQREGGDVADVPKEPSARARMVTARLRELDAEAARRQPKRWWERKAKEPEPWQPDGWRTGPAWQGTRGNRNRSGRWIAGFVALFAVSASVVTYLDDAAPGLGSGGEAAPLPAETAAPSVAPADEVFPDRPTLKEPFNGSPAQRWESGADAIEPPEAEAVNGVSAERVADGARLLKEFLVAANLDPEVLAGGEPTEAVAMLDPIGRELVEQTRDSLASPSAEQDPLWLFSRFDTDEVKLIEDVRVRGRMEVTAGEEKGKAVITSDYSFVYAVENVDVPGEVTRTLVRREIHTEVVDPARWQATEGTLWIANVFMEYGNSSCSVYDGLLHPTFDSERMGDPAPTGPTADPYDRSESLGGEDGLNEECGVVSRI
ncbi:hypothetical protein [Streptomyces chumphonensis]|uniref:hypothetical protein n=1 Tax=Streptomyces chumphonensis TaxID=1214925 RepID=UPI003D70ECBC